MLDRRQFVGEFTAVIAAAVVPRSLRAQEPGQSAATNAPMNEGAYRPVRLPAVGSGPSMTNDERDKLEHEIHCQCACNLDVFTCRTTDFTCPVSPAMHRDVMSLVEGGHNAQEILDAFVGAYGERALMAPTKSGFNWAAYVVPFLALGAGTLVVAALLRTWKRETTLASSPARNVPVEGTADEIAAIDAAVRRDDA